MKAGKSEKCIRKLTGLVINYQQPAFIPVPLGIERSIPGQVKLIADNEYIDSSLRTSSPPQQVEYQGQNQTDEEHGGNGKEEGEVFPAINISPETKPVIPKRIEPNNNPV